MILRPVFGLAAVISISSFHYGAMGYLGYDPSHEAEVIINFALIFCVSWWTYSDAHERNSFRPFQFGELLIFFLPIVLPVYMYSTRGWRGIPLAFGLYLMMYIPNIIGWVAFYANPEQWSPALFN